MCISKVKYGKADIPATVFEVKKMALREKTHKAEFTFPVSYGVW